LNLKTYSKEQLHCIALCMIKGVGYVYADKLINYFGSAENVFLASPKELIRNTQTQPSYVSEIVSKKTITEAEILIKEHTKANIDIITPWDDLYPHRLKHTTNAPTILFCKGTNFLNHKKIVSVVGTRNPTNYGRKVVNDFIENLVAHSTLIVSGLAYGIDITAHKCALNLNLPTVAVYAGGLDMVYPKEHEKVANSIISHGGLVTEYQLGTKVETYQFAARNRIIAGMADATIVIEAPERSGALITAYYANDYNREVFAVPGSLYDKNSVGCHNLIMKNQAHLITSINDLILIMNWDRESLQSVKAKQLSISLELTLSENEESLLKLIAQYSHGIHIDDISASVKLTVGQLSAILLHLEMKELIVALPGKKYRLQV
jgi:DNA processing protein